VIFSGKTLWEGESPFNGKVKVTESSGIRRLVVGGYTQSRTLDKDGKTGFYWDSFAENIPPPSKDSKILILGVCAGTSAKILTNKFGPVAIDGVEIDPVIIDLGKKYFYLNEPNIKVFTEDAKEYVKKLNTKYDVIYVDIFRGSKTPRFLSEKPFLEKIKEQLHQDGMVVVNKICNDKSEDEEFVRNIAKVFPDYTVLREKGNSYQQNIMFYGKA
jgi:spermidine synthase